jgi:hypothetical protein
MLKSHRTDFNRLVILIRYTSCDALSSLPLIREDQSTFLPSGVLIEWKREHHSDFGLSDNPKALACSQAAAVNRGFD